MQPEYSIREYVYSHKTKTFEKTHRSEKIGMLYAQLYDGGKLGIGWSLCNKQDIFNNNVALQIAQKRSKYYINNNDIGINNSIIESNDIINIVTDTSKKTYDVKILHVLKNIISSVLMDNDNDSKTEIQPSLTQPSLIVKNIIPNSIHSQLLHFVKRCEKYFKNVELPKWVNNL